MLPGLLIAFAKFDGLCGLPLHHKSEGSEQNAPFLHPFECTSNAMHTRECNAHKASLSQERYRRGIQEAT